jgi:fluoride exporter
MNVVPQMLLVGAGGFLGSIARFVVSRGVNSVLGTAFPWGTFAVNISGSFLLGMAATLVAEKLLPFPDAIRLSFAIGFIGAYTTFSTFEQETNTLFEDGSWLPALLNIAGSVIAGFIALKIGIALARRLL